ncbi:MAG: (Fe-S)-binding protein [Planctomycetota bacterium]
METKTPFIEVLEEIKEAGGDIFRLCYQCGKCDTVCPWNHVRNFSIRKIIREAAFGLTEIESEDIWRCTTCGNCPEKCPRGVDQIELGVALRKLAANYDVIHASARPAKAAKASLTAEGNPLNENRAERADWAKGLSVKPFTEKMEILFFGCCYMSYDPRMKKVARATVEILNKAGVDYGILGTKESCCGESIRKTGAEDTYKKLAKDNIKAFIDNGVRKIVVSSPHCLEAFKKEYAEFMVRFEVVHMTQFLLELIKQGRLEIIGEYGKKATYHDPCYLGRHNQIFDEPREILHRIPGFTLIEMAASRKNSFCCGGGGGRVWMETPKGERFSDLRVEQARAIGAEVLVTACPYCITMFEDSRLTLDVEDDIEIKDITEIIQEVVQKT